MRGSGRSGKPAVGGKSVSSGACKGESVIHRFMKSKVGDMRCAYGGALGGAGSSHDGGE